MLTVAPTRLEDLGPVAADMRPEDRAEVQAASGCSPLEALQFGLATSVECATVHAPRGPIAIFGVVPSVAGNTRIGSPWMLGTPGITGHWFEFARRSRDEFHAMRQRWDRLENHVDDRNELHKRWLRWLGFEFTELIEHFGVERRPFWRFTFHV